MTLISNSRFLFGAACLALAGALAGGPAARAQSAAPATPTVQLPAGVENGTDNLFASAVAGDAVGDLVVKLKLKLMVKLMNYSNSPRPVKVNLAGAKKMGKTGRAIVMTLTATVPVVEVDATATAVRTMPQVLTAIPYYAWANRGKGEMTVWFPKKITNVALLSRPPRK